jgi:hypothetical protein
MANKRGSNRIGWNRRGPSTADQLAQAQELGNPNSYHWQNKARNYKQRLIDVMGEAAYMEWIDRLYPDDADDLTWQELAEQLEAKLQVEQGAPGDKECARHSWVNDPRHFKTRN